MAESKSPERVLPLSEVLSKAAHRAVGGGVPGAIAMGLQVTTLMWLRTTVNYQYRNGTSTRQALQTLYRDGGLRRFYRGYGPAMAQAPLSRFGDTAANAGVLSLLDSYDATRGLPVMAKTVAASVTAACWRMALMPIDTFKSSLQVNGANGARLVLDKIKMNGPGVLFHGSLAAASASLAGHFPWFVTFNFLNDRLPHAPEDSTGLKLGRTALMGFTASAVSDSVSNGIRVVKVTRQTSSTPVTYPEAVRSVVAADGIVGLLGRGLKTKIATNGIQGLTFAVLWKQLQAVLFPDHEAGGARK